LNDEERFRNRLGNDTLIVPLDNPYVPDNLKAYVDAEKDAPTPKAFTLTAAPDAGGKTLSVSGRLVLDQSRCKLLGRLVPPPQFLHVKPIPMNKVGAALGLSGGHSVLLSHFCCRQRSVWSPVVPLEPPPPPSVRLGAPPWQFATLSSIPFSNPSTFLFVVPGHQL
jgi:hypothetical protein